MSSWWFLDVVFDISLPTPFPYLVFPIPSLVASQVVRAKLDKRVG